MKFAFVTVYVNDMDESMEFYHHVMGLEIQTRHPIGGGGEMAMLGKADEPQIELLYAPSVKPSYNGFSIGIEVEDLDTAVQLLAQKGHAVHRGPISPAPNVRFSFVRDPNGIEIELIEYQK